MKKIVVVLNSNTNRQSAKKNIRFEHELLAEIQDIKPTEMSFSYWVKEACWEKIYSTNKPSDVYTHIEQNTKHSVRTSTPEIDESTEVLVKQWHSQGMFHQQIADRLNQMERLTSDGKPWTRLLVRQVVNN